MTLPLQGRGREFERTADTGAVSGAEYLPRPTNGIMKDLISFLIEAGKLKLVERKGWVMDGVNNPESVSDHSWRTALMVMVLGNGRNLNIEKCIKMALVHDLPEVRTGDIVEVEKRNYNVPGTAPPKESFDQTTTEDRHKAEEDAAKDMFSENKKLFDLWKEYNENKTKEANFVKDVDKLEMAIQALQYEKDGNYKSKTIQHYYNYSRDKIKNPEILKILNEIEKMRPNGPVDQR